MKRVNLVEYYELAELLQYARRTVGQDTVTGGSFWIATYDLPARLRSFANEDNGFSTSKRIALDLAQSIEGWLSEHLYDGNSPQSAAPPKFDDSFSSWQFSAVRNKLDMFKTVFTAECAEVDVYSVEQISLYKTSDLVSAASNTLPVGTRENVPLGAKVEFDDAGRCLAFGLPTACGFHALRGVELVIEGYLRAFGVTKKLQSWNDYVESAKALAESSEEKKPALKVSQMIDRLRSLDRNPLMHPRDTLDEVGADMLFRLSSLTVYEIVKDMKANGRSMPEPANDEASAEGVVTALPAPKKKPGKEAAA